MTLPVLTVAQKRFVLVVDAGYAHSLPTLAVSGRQRAMCNRLVRMGVLRSLEGRGPFPTRIVPTGLGMWAVGTFKAGKSLHQEVREIQLNSFLTSERKAA